MSVYSWLPQLLGVFVFVTTLLAYQRNPQFHDACNHHEPLSETSILVGKCVMAVFAFSILAQLKVAMVQGRHMTNGSYQSLVTTMIINAIAVTSIVVTLQRPDVHCKDPFGVVYHQARYIEWIVTVPLLGFATVMPMPGAPIRWEDAGVVVSLFCCILCGWMYQFFDSLSFAVIGIILSFIFFFSAYYFLKMSYDNEASNAESLNVINALSARLELKKNLCIALALLLPVFPTLYVLMTLGFLSVDALFILSTSLDVITKGLFAQTVMESQLSVLLCMQVELESLKIAGLRRHKFLKFLLHEVGVPLNTIVMGMDCLEEMHRNLPISSNVSEIMEEVNQATGNIEDLLLNCNIHQLLEEKQFELKKEPFALHEMIKNISTMAKLQEKDIILVVKVSEDLPSRVIGNSQLLSLFIVYVILNAYRRSHGTKSVNLQVKITPEGTKRKASGDICSVMINVTDSGDVLDDAAENAMFAAYDILDTSEMMNKVYYSTLRMSIGKEMLKLHGGSVNIVRKTDFSVGNTVSIVVPFELESKDKSPVEETGGNKSLLSYFTKSTPPTKTIKRAEPQNKSGSSGGTSSNECGGNDYLSPTGSAVVGHRSGSPLTKHLAPKTAVGAVLKLQVADNDFVSTQSQKASSHDEDKYISSIHSDEFTTDNDPFASHVLDKDDSANHGTSSVSGSTAQITRVPSLINNAARKTVELKHLNSMLRLTATATAEEPSLHTVIKRGNSDIAAMDSLPVASLGGVMQAESTNQGSAVGTTDPSLPSSHSTSGEMCKPPPASDSPSSIGMQEQQQPAVDARPSPPDKAICKAIPRALVVDDTPSNRKMLQRLLQTKGISPDLACDGQEAVDTYLKHDSGHYDLIFMDFTMPVMNGVDATRLIREHGYKHGVVAVTANMMQEDFIKFQEAGADLVVMKPLKQDKLSDILACYVPEEDWATSVRERLSRIAVSPHC